tara:strand:- start:326 stop:535 length:210 start_codon:yes stop_codon:yes gene_type:complete
MFFTNECRSENKVATGNYLEITMYLHFDTARQERMKSERLAETKEAVKDAVGAFAILAMLYVGLFIPNL